MRRRSFQSLLGLALGVAVIAACGGASIPFQNRVDELAADVAALTTRVQTLETENATLAGEVQTLSQDLQQHEADPDAHHPADAGGVSGLGLNYIIALQGIFPSRALEAPAEGSSDLQIPPPQTSFLDPYLGGIVLFAGNFAPQGWAFCDGQILSIAANQALFSLLGTTYGGNGQTTFALPDLRGLTPVHPSATVPLGGHTP